MQLFFTHVNPSYLLLLLIATATNNFQLAMFFSLWIFAEYINIRFCEVWVIMSGFFTKE